MSIASTVPCIKLSSSSCSSTASSNSSSSTTSSTFRLFTHTKPFTVRCSNADGPLRRPSSPSLKEPTPPMKPIAPNSPPSLSPSPSPSLSPSPSASKPIVSTGVSSSQNVVTMEFQRKMAIELQEYFRKKKLEEASQGPFFGWVAKNEIGNGRWAMFGFAVGLLTEYATGTDFVDQMKILLSNFGIVDLD
ncbi:hypothetical protein MKX01_003412 [Papaver californicum]|nr:hypothetical protein MKX01_003412 [Papaver californicum]